MGKKGGWFRSVKKAIGNSEPKEPKDQPSKSKKKWFGKKKATDPIPNEEAEASAEIIAIVSATTTTPQAVSAPSPPPQEKLEIKEIEEMQKQHSSSIAIATAKAAEAAMAAAMAAAELARLTNATRFPGKSNEEVAAIRIQTAFRGCLARRALRVLRGLERMKTLMQGPSVKRQTANTLKCMQGLVRVQSEIHARRLRTSEENQARQRQLLDKHAKELDKLQSIQKNGDDWNTSAKSKEQVQARLRNKHEASIKRERALAYSFNHQRTWRNSATTKPAQTLFMESINPHWGWSWLERWLDARPWENASPGNPDLAPLRSSLNPATPSGSQIAKALLYHVTERERPQSATSSPRSVQSSSSLRANTIKQRNSTGRLSTSSTPKAKPKASASARASPRKVLNRDDHDDAKSTVSLQSDLGRRKSVAREADNVSLASSRNNEGVAVPSYMSSTESARARSRLGSPSSNGDGKRRASYNSSPARSRRSTASITDANSVGDGN